MVKVSVIVPVYNQEEYIETCLCSIKNQDLTEFECIVVNDGSIDGTSEKIKKFTDDPRFLLICQENRGLAQARWTGVRNAQSEYVCFVDADDYVEYNILSTLYKNIRENNVELVSCGYYTEYLTRGEQVVHEGISGLFDVQEALFAVNNRKSIFTAAWNKIYIRSLLTEDCFPKEHSAGQDYYSTCKYISKCKRVMHISDTLYHYIHNMHGISKGRYSAAIRLELKYNIPLQYSLVEKYPQIRNTVMRFSVYECLCIYNSMIRSRINEKNTEEELLKVLCGEYGKKYIIDKDNSIGYRLCVFLIMYIRPLYKFLYPKLLESKLYFVLANRF